MNEFYPNEGENPLYVYGPVESLEEENPFKKLSYIHDEQALKEDLFSEMHGLVFGDDMEERKLRKELLVHGPVRYYGHHGADLYPEEGYPGTGGRGISRNGGAEARFDMNKSSRVKDPNKLVPLSEAYVLPEIFTGEGGTKPGVGGAAPSGYDRHGLLNVPSKKRLEKELAHRLEIGEIHQNLQDDVVLSPLNVKYPKDYKVYYVNVGGIRKLMPNYNLNPSHKMDLNKRISDQAWTDFNNQEVLRDFIKIIQEKKRKRKVRGHARTRLKDESTRQRVSNAYNIHMSPKKRISTADSKEFAPLSDLGDITAGVRSGRRIRFSDITGKEDSEGEEKKEGVKSGSGTDERIYVPGKTEVDDLLEQGQSENFGHEDSHPAGGERMVRFQLPVSENRPKKKYVSPPPMLTQDEFDEDEEGENDDDEEGEDGDNSHGN